jgi:hypothetical protein
MYPATEQDVLSMKERVDECVRMATLELKSKLERKGLSEEQDSVRNKRFDKKIQKKRARNQKKRTIIDI